MSSSLVDRSPAVATRAPALDEGAGPRTSLAVKRIGDVILALTGLLLLSPLLVLIAIAIRAEDGGPVLFRQERLGRGGVPFRVVKVRTMGVDAERRKAGLLGANESSGLLFKMRSDPRITAVGRWLRRTSLDELPQLLNVLTGEMSLVGPRPLPVLDPAAYTGDAVRRFEVRPGITGLWQVSGRSDLDWDDAVRLDVRYVDEWSLGLDLRILLATLPAVVRGSGAY
jgi:lipopolysaccharide/colanic/teichoic acid biosynthesis glycosyltransferase